MQELQINGITGDGVLKFRYIPQRWHVDFRNTFDEVVSTYSFVSRMVAEETALEAPNAIFYLCDCADRMCKFQ